MYQNIVEFFTSMSIETLQISMLASLSITFMLLTLRLHHKNRDLKIRVREIRPYAEKYIQICKFVKKHCGIDRKDVVIEYGKTRSRVRDKRPRISIKGTYKDMHMRLENEYLLVDSTIENSEILRGKGRGKIEMIGSIELKCLITNLFTTTETIGDGSKKLIIKK